jgi:hypothetical protein
MMRHLPVAAAAALILFAVPTTLIATAAPNANGNDVLLPGGNVYQLDDDGAFHMIPDVATANAMHLDWNNLEQTDELSGPVGDTYVSVAPPVKTLAAGTRTAARPIPPANGNDVILPDGSVYQIDDEGVYHLVPDVQTGNAMHVNWNDLQQADSIDGPVGDPIGS